jgi:hypothetical protein
MVRPVSPLGGAPSSSSAMRQQSSIVAPSGGSLTASAIARPGSAKGSATLGLTRNNSARVDQGYDELHNRRGHEIEILNIDLGRVHARPGACDTTTICLGLFTADDLHAVREELGLSRRYGAEFLEKRMR